MNDLAARLGRLEDIEAIRALKARYAAHADAKFTTDHRRQPAEIFDHFAWSQARCFTEDAVWHGGADFGASLQGRSALFDWFRHGPWSFALHLYSSPVIEVAGDKASGRWTLWEVATIERDQRAVFLAGTTEEEYQRTGEGWLQSSMRFRIAFTTPFDGPGWSTLRNVFAGPLAVGEADVRLQEIT